MPIKYQKLGSMYGEKVKVTVAIDDPIAFTSATVKCVDETDGTKTKTATITKDKLSCSFFVLAGHTYHIEYSEVEGYSIPSNTSSKVALGAKTTEYQATYYYFTATINVTYPQGATLTCTLGDTVYTAETTTGTHTFKVHEAGAWTVKATNGTDTDIKQVKVTRSGQTESVELAFVRIYGIKRNVANSSPTWTRTDQAVGMTATASVGTKAGSSSFDSCMPWKGIVREKVGADVMVKIPKFYFKRYMEGNTEHIKIATGPSDGFAIHPLFNHAGVEKDFAYIGAYKTSSNNKSVSGANPQVNQTRATMRSNAKNKGAGWGLIDIAALSAIQMLFLVEYATNDSQKAIGRGYCDGSSALRSGTCDSVPGLTGRPAGTDGKVDVVYRGIEGLWGNVFEWIDGVNFFDWKIFVCNDQSKYADDTSSEYTELSYRRPNSNSYITKEGVDTKTNSHVMLPVEASGGSETTHFCDYMYYGSGHRVLASSGYWSYGSTCGLFYASCNYTSSYSNSPFGSRLLYIPS